MSVGRHLGGSGIFCSEMEASVVSSVSCKESEVTFFSYLMGVVYFCKTFFFFQKVSKITIFLSTSRGAVTFYFSSLYHFCVGQREETFRLRKGT